MDRLIEVIRGITLLGIWGCATLAAISSNFKNIPIIPLAVAFLISVLCLLIWSGHQFRFNYNER